MDLKSLQMLSIDELLELGQTHKCIESSKMSGDGFEFTIAGGVGKIMVSADQAKAFLLGCLVGARILQA